MAQDTRQDADPASLLAQLNAALAPTTPYRLALVDPATVKPIDDNAHYMNKRVFEQLVANVRADGNLASVPLCHLQGGVYTCLSGNHRLEAAALAGIAQVLILYTDADMSHSQRRAMQLSHNALVGQDDPNKLRTLYEQITELELKLYSGLDDTLLETLKPVDLTRLVEEPLRLEEVVLAFLPIEIARLQEILKRLGGKAKRHKWVARYEDFDRFVEVLLTYKEAEGIVNTATALAAMCDLVEEYLHAERGPTAEGSPADGAGDTPSLDA